MNGRRIPDETEIYAPGDYGRLKGFWFCKPPKGGMGSLSNHKVEEHEDGTITVSPSILVTSYSEVKGEKTVWHGYLEKGVWKEC